jgi:hypothetical protein
MAQTNSDYNNNTSIKTQQCSIFSRCVVDSFEAVQVSNIIQSHGCDVFSVFIGESKDTPYEIWAKYESSRQLIEIDLKINEFFNHYPHRQGR